jgi:hypothetical protein
MKWLLTLLHTWPYQPHSATHIEALVCRNTSRTRRKWPRVWRTTNLFAENLGPNITASSSHSSTKPFWPSNHFKNADLGTVINQNRIYEEWPSPNCMLQGHVRTSPPPPYRAALSHQNSIASFATLQVLSCLHSLGLRCSCCNVVRFCCDLEACNLVTTFVQYSGNRSVQNYLSSVPERHAMKKWRSLPRHLIEMSGRFAPVPIG